MYLEIGNGDHGIVLSSFDASKQQSVSEAMAKELKVDTEMAGSILENTPIVIFGDLTEEIAKLVLEKMKRLSDAGCVLELAEAPFDATRRMRWPRLHRFVRFAQREVAKGYSTAMHIACSKCGTGLMVDLADADEAAAAPAPGEPVAIDPGEALELVPPTPEVSAEELVELPVEEPAEELVELPAEEPVEELVELPAEEPVEEIIELPADEDAAYAGEAPDKIMELDEFETSLGELDLQGPSDLTGEGEIDILTPESAEPVEAEVVEAVPEEIPVEEVEVATTDEAVVPVKEEPAGDGQSVFRVILSKIRSDKMRSEAAEIIASVQGIPQKEAMEVAGKLIITAAKDVTEARAKEIADMFTEKKIKALVTKRK